MAARDESSDALRHARVAIDKANSLQDGVSHAASASANLLPAVGGVASGFMAAEAIAITAVLQTGIIVRDALLNAKTNVRAHACARVR